MGWYMYNSTLLLIWGGTCTKHIVMNCTAVVFLNLEMSGVNFSNTTLTEVHATTYHV